MDLQSNPLYSIISVPIVLNPHGNEPTFLKFDSWSLRAVLIHIITTNVLNYIKKECKKKKVLCIQKKQLTQFLKMGSIPC